MIRCSCIQKVDDWDFDSITNFTRDGLVFLKLGKHLKWECLVVSDVELEQAFADRITEFMVSASTSYSLATHELVMKQMLNIEPIPEDILDSQVVNYEKKEETKLIFKNGLEILFIAPYAIRDKYKK